MCASAMQAQAAEGLLLGLHFKMRVQVSDDERTIYPLQPMAFGRPRLVTHVDSKGDFARMTAVKGGFNLNVCDKSNFEVGPSETVLIGGTPGLMVLDRTIKGAPIETQGYWYWETESHDDDPDNWRNGGERRVLIRRNIQRKPRP